MVNIKAGSPGDVDVRYRKTAWTIYLMLVAGFLAITAWQIYVSVQQRANPPTRTRIQANTVYKQPQYWICPFGGFDATYLADSVSCDWEYTGTSDAESLYWEGDPYDDSKPGHLPKCNVTIDEDTNCTIMNVDRSFSLPGKQFQMYGYFVFNYSIPLNPQTNKTDPTALQWTMYMIDDSTPTIDDASETYFRFGSNQVKVYATKKTYLQSADVWDYDTATTFTDTVGIKNTLEDGWQEFMVIQLSIPNLLVTVIEEVDPLNVTTTLGTIGGFWNYVGVIFGLIFTLRLPSTAVALWTGGTTAVAIAEKPSTEAKTGGTEMAPRVHAHAPGSFATVPSSPPASEASPQAVAVRLDH